MTFNNKHQLKKNPEDKITDAQALDKPYQKLPYTKLKKK